MAEPKTIYCPRCGRAACHYDGRQKINPRGRCSKCRKIIVYHIDTDSVERKSAEKRSTGSGKAFF